MNNPSQKPKWLYITIFLLFLGCQKEQPAQIKLDSGLGTHFSLIQEGKTGSARVRLRQWMDRNGDSSQSMFLMGLSYHHDSQYSQAVEWFERATTYPQAQTYAPVWHYLGWSYYYMGQLDPSKNAFEHFLSLQPDEGDSLFALGLIATEEAKFNDAAKYFNDSIASSQGGTLLQAKAKSRLADVYAALDEWEQAILLYQESVALNPDLYEAWYRLSQALRREGNGKESIAAFQQFELAKQRVRPDLLAQTRFPE